MRIIIPNRVKNLINEMPKNVTYKKNAVKIYAAFYNKSVLADKNGYFPVASTYLVSINRRYQYFVNLLIENGVIEYKKGLAQDKNDIFKVKETKYYNTEKGICMKYKFLIDQNDGEEIDVEMVCSKNTRWYDVLQSSLHQKGFDIKIKRDNYGRRVHHSAIINYKHDFKGYYSIDSVCSQPRLLWLMMSQKGVIDFTYNEIFDNDKDFYNFLVAELNLDDRNAAKNLFMFWLNGAGYVPHTGIHKLFPVASQFLKDVKKNNYKDSGSMLQRVESKIFIDDLLNNVPADFCLPIHDCLLVEASDADNVLSYCEEKYPMLRFKKELLK